MIRVLTADEPLGLQANLTSDERIEVSPHYPPCTMSCTAPAGATDTASDCAEVQRAFPPCTSAFRTSLRRLQRAERGSVGVLWVVMKGSPGGRAAAGAASSARQRTALLRLHMAPSLTTTTGCCWLVLAASDSKTCRHALRIDRHHGVQIEQIDPLDGCVQSWLQGTDRPQSSAVSPVAGISTTGGCAEPASAIHACTIHRMQGRRGPPAPGCHWLPVRIVR